MVVYLKVFYESIRQALQQLTSNKLRTFLSLLGISIGIFCIIGILAAVDSLDSYIRKNLEELGDDVVYVSKWPFVDGAGNWWDWMKRPYPNYDEYERLKKNSQTASLISYHVDLGNKTLKYKSNSAERVGLVAVTNEFSEMFSLNFEKGRFFSPAEFNYGAHSIVIGAEVADALFGTIEPIGRKIKLLGKKYDVIGVLEREGDDGMNVANFDDAMLVTYNNGKTLANLNSRQFFNSTIAVKANPGISVLNLKDDLRGNLRSYRKLKPKEKDNFALNEMSMIANVLDSFFATLNVLAIIIGGFAMLVGGVSVANIMFVSVKERTSIIGVKKSLGAKPFIILLEFLIEAIILCVIGGLIGLGLIFIITSILSQVINFELFLSVSNVAIGMAVSILVGLISGFIPALRASQLDPVVAMRQK